MSLYVAAFGCRMTDMMISKVCLAGAVIISLTNYPLMDLSIGICMYVCVYHSKRTVS